MDNFTLHHGDCLDLLTAIPDCSVDMVLADLPYGTTRSRWDSVIPLDALWEQYRRVTKPRAAIVLTAVQPFTTTLIASNLSMFRYCWTWKKTKHGNFMNAKNAPLRITEDIVVFSTGTMANGSSRRMPYNPQGLRRVERLRREVVRDDESTVGNRPSRKGEWVQGFEGYPSNLIVFPSVASPVHPTQKPTALLEYLIRTYTDDGAVVLDNAMGSGSTGVACLNTGRDFIGIERDPRFFEIAQDRISQARAQLHAANDNHRQRSLFDDAA
jgi:site-specific DNA-methyltransferase (adenine-specific)